MESKNDELNFENPNLDKPVNVTEYIQVALNLKSREVVTVKGMNTRGGDDGLSIPKLSKGVKRGDIYSVYEVSVFQSDEKTKEGILYVKEEK